MLRAKIRSVKLSELPDMSWQDKAENWTGDGVFRLQYELGGYNQISMPE